MENKRRLRRFAIQLNAQYCFDDREESWKECTIIDATHEGMGIRFKAPEKIDTGSNIHLELLVAKAIKPIRIQGTLKWIKKGDNYFVGGVKLTETLDAIIWSNLIHYLS
jgi:hypothetical protein